MSVDAVLAREVVRELLLGGGEFADIFCEDTVFSTLSAEDGRMDKVSAGRERGAGLRLVKDGVTHFGSTVDLSPQGLLGLARDLAAGASSSDIPGGAQGGLRGEPYRRSVRRGEPPESPPGTSQSDELELLPLDLKAAFVLRGMQAASKSDRRVVSARAVARDSVSRVLVANSRGALAQETRSQAVYMVHVVAGEGGKMETGYEPEGGPDARDLFRGDPERAALAAVRRALLTLSAPEAPSGRMTVVLSSEAGGTMVHEAVGHGLEADLAGKAMSVYAGKLGQKVASELVTVVDDPTLPGRRGSYSFDDEGTGAVRTVLVDRGVLVAYLNDLSSAERMGVPANGHGRRQSFRHWPIPRMGNTLILPGKDDPRAIVRSVERGLLVKRMGGGQVNPASGDFVFEVSEGSLIEKGEACGPVRGATLAGNGPEVLAAVDMVGDDLGFGIGTCGKEGQGVPVSDAQPTLRIPEIAVGGRDATGGRG